MIVPMLKYAFALHHKQYEPFLADIKELGVIDLIACKQTPACDEMTSLQNRKEQIHQLLTQLSHYRDEKSGGISGSDNPSAKIIEQANELFTQLGHFKQEQGILNKKTEEQLLWGDYPANLLFELQQAGLEIQFYSISAKKFDLAWTEQFAVEVINHTDKEIFFASLQTTPAMFPGARQIKFEAPLSVLQNQQKEIEQEIAKTEQALKQLADENFSGLRKQLSCIEEEIQWIDVVSNRTDTIGESTLFILEGWVPEDKNQELNAYLEQTEIVYLMQKPLFDDQPPVQLRNSRFVKLFEPIAKLFALPTYSELDLTAYFAPFFMLFFGFCLGDAGYGLVLLIGTSLYKPYASPDMKPFLSLGQLFGLSTLIMGLIFGTFFGIQLATVPSFEGVKDLFLESSQIFNLSLIIGAVQIIFGIVLRIKNQLRSATPTTALSSAGWLLLFLSAGIFSFLLKEKELSLVVVISEKIAYVIALMLILFFSGTGPVYLRIPGGLWEMYNTVTGIFGDLLSYIRLFALGIASSILGLVINQMAVSFGKAPYVGPVIFILIVIIGHTANLAISSLGAFVHPMRLTFVEFYKNAGFKGGGKAYSPFSTTQKNNNN